MSSRTERFEREAKSAPNPKRKSSEEEEEEKEAEENETLRFTPEQEATLVQESNELKSAANTEFTAAKYEEAIETYGKALDSCPRYLYYDRAVLKSNVAACNVKTFAWKEAVTAAGECLDLLDQAEGKKPKNDKEGADEDGKLDGNGVDKEGKEEEADEEIISAGAAKAEDTSADARKKKDIDRIRAKALLRRAKAGMEISSWSSLQGAEADYKSLYQMPDLSPTDKKIVQKALAILPGKIKVTQEKEVGEMMGKLKELGNGILKPFGLSTDNFQMTKDEKTGGYSMNFNQGGGKS